MGLRPLLPAGYRPDPGIRRVVYLQMSRAQSPAKLQNLTSWRSPVDLVRIIMVLSLPVTATFLLQSLINFVDIRMISSLGSSALASMGVGRQVLWLISSLFIGMGAGVTAYVARFTGAGDHEKAKSYATIGIISAAVIGLLVTVVGYIVGDQPLKYMVTSEAGGVNEAAVEATRKYVWDYIRVIYLGLAGTGAMFAVNSVFNSLGRTIYPMWMLIISNVVNFVGNLLLIRHFEVAGCAFSTVMTTVIASAVGLLILSSLKSVTWDLKLLLLRPLRRAWEMMKLGLPASLAVVARSLAMLAMNKIITFLPNSVVGQSALVVGIMAESLAFMPAFAFSISASTLVGQNLGAKQEKQARISSIYCVGFSQVIMVVMGLLMFFFPEWFILLFIGNNAPEVTPYAVQFLRIMALCLPGLGVSMTLGGVLRGSGDTRTAALITLTSMWIVRVPLVAFMALDDIWGTGLGLGMGLTGVWWAMTITVYIEAALSFWRFQSNRWAKIKLAEV
jgi:putative MATE family efflux protein